MRGKKNHLVVTFVISFMYDTISNDVMKRMNSGVVSRYMLLHFVHGCEESESLPSYRSDCSATLAM